MTVARLNYTGRKRIPREEVIVELSAREDGPASFTVVVNLGRLDLPDDALVTIEAYRRTWVQREWLGHVKDVGDSAHGPFELVGMHDAAGIKFRIKVSGSGDTEERGKLLAAADRLVPAATADTPEEVVSLLPVGVEDLGDLVWRVDCDPATSPVLKVSRPLGRDIARKPYFRSLVFPGALQQILDVVRLSGTSTSEFDDQDWQLDWLHFGRALAGPYPEEDLSEDPWDVWCAAVVDQFARKHRLRHQFVTWHEEVEQ